MKKILCSLILLMMLISQSAFALVYTPTKRLKVTDSSGTPITQLIITNGTSVTTEAIPVDNNIGYGVILVTEDQTGGAGNISVTAEYSDDMGKQFQTTYTSTAGTLTADPAIVSSMGNSTRRIQYTARLAKFVHFVISATTTSRVTFDFTYQRDQ